MGQRNSSATAHKASGQDKAILDLKIQRDRLRKYQKHLTAVIAKEHELARQHLVEHQDRQRALLILKKKRYQQSLLDKCEDQIMTVEQLTQSIEFAVVEQQVVAGLKSGTQMLKLLNEQMRVEDVERLMMDTEDAIEYQREVNQMLGQQLSQQDVEDVEAELDRLMAAQELADSKKLDMSQLPNVPVGGIESKPIDDGNITTDFKEQKAVRTKQLVLEES